MNQYYTLWSVYKWLVTATKWWYKLYKYICHLQILQQFVVYEITVPEECAYNITHKELATKVWAYISVCQLTVAALNGTTTHY